MMSMYTRLLRPPEHTFFLFGPRGVGKTTWLKEAFPDALWIDLTNTSQFLRFHADPDQLKSYVRAHPKNKWVVIDEVQKAPRLLDSIHNLFNEDGREKWKFVLTGSSARKLHEQGVNLLAGRAIQKFLFPMITREVPESRNVLDCLRFGSLPSVLNSNDDQSKIDTLEAYVATYLEQEIRQEALVRSLESFHRFLRVAAAYHGQILNVSAIARDAGVARPSVNGYFDVLYETLVATNVTACTPRFKVKEISHPKFYFFDAGVVRAISGMLRDPLDSAEKGPLLESWVLHELRAAMSYGNHGGEISYWSVQGGGEIDFIWSRGKHRVGIEVKASNRWRTEFGKSLREMFDKKLLTRAYAVYLGDDRLKDGPISVLPAHEWAHAVDEMFT